MGAEHALDLMFPHDAFQIFDFTQIGEFSRGHEALSVNIADNVEILFPRGQIGGDFELIDQAGGDQYCSRSILRELAPDEIVMSEDGDNDDELLEACKRSVCD